MLKVDQRLYNLCVMMSKSQMVLLCERLSSLVQVYLHTLPSDDPVRIGGGVMTMGRENPPSLALVCMGNEWVFP